MKYQGSPSYPPCPTPLGVTPPMRDPEAQGPTPIDILQAQIARLEVENSRYRIALEDVRHKDQARLQMGGYPIHSFGWIANNALNTPESTNVCKHIFSQWDCNVLFCSDCGLRLNPNPDCQGGTHV